MTSPATLDLPTRRIAYTVSGPDDGPVLVLGSSVGSTGTMWEPQVAALSGTHRVVRYDHRGHGGSRPSTPPRSIADLGGDVVALLDHLGVAKASLAGLSLGGMVAMWVAAHHPDRVDRVALFCTAALLGPRENWLQRAAAVRGAGMASIADAVLARWFTPGYPARHLDVVARLRAEFEAVDPEAYAACCESIADMDLREDLARISAPTLVVAGRDDPATPPALAEDIAGRIRGARLAVVPDAAHLGSVEQPAAFTALLLGHLDGALDGGSGPSYDEGMALRRVLEGDS